MAPRLPVVLFLALPWVGCGSDPVLTPDAGDASRDSAALEVEASDAGDAAADDVALDLISPDVAAPDGTAPDGTAPDGTAPDGAAPDVAAPDGALPDVGVDAGAALDVDLPVPDSAFDGMADVVDDRATDARVDAVADVVADAPFDARLDASVDARPDAALDAPLDARTDAASDARSDVAPDAPAGPRVDRTMPQLHSFSFRANEADAMARRALGNETAFLDTRVAPRGRLVVYLHGAGAPTTCGSNEHGRLLASWGFHVLGPCYVSDYGVGNCGADIGGCRLEAFEGVDHHPFVTITPPDAIETRVVRALQLLQRRHPGGDWQYYLDGARPRWGAIIISGISHGASSAGLIGQVRSVDRAVMLSGPLDSGQAWLARTGLTARSRYWGFTHRMDPQHSGHLAAFATLSVPGTPVFIDGMSAPYGGTHRLATAAMTSDGHSSTQAGGSSPRDAGGRYLFEAAWRLMYGVSP